MNHTEAITEYQCPGCVNGPAGPACPKFKPNSEGCTNHSAGTLMMGKGIIFLGLPKGFNRLGPSGFVEEWQKSFDIYASMDELLKNSSLSTIFSVPVWLYIDERGNTMTRWFSPRTNTGWTAVIVGDHSTHPRFANTIKLTAQQVKEMD